MLVSSSAPIVRERTQGSSCQSLSMARYGSSPSSFFDIVYVLDFLFLTLSNANCVSETVLSWGSIVVAMFFGRALILFVNADSDAD